MRAIVYQDYGPPNVLKLTEVEKPVPKANEVLIEVQSAAVNYSDPTFVSGKPFLVRLMGAGLLRPKITIPGADVSGRVAAIGEQVTLLKPGDEVFGDISSCGWGGFAEFVCAEEEMLILKPRGATFDEAAAMPQASVTALQGLRDNGQIKAGQRVLINRASGGIGTFAVQIAKSFGAEVTAVCSNKNIDLVRSIGADHVIEYTQQDFTQIQARYDLIFDVVANRSVVDYARALCPGGIYVACAFNPSSLLLGAFISLIGRRKVSSLIAKTAPKDLAAIRELYDSGKLRPVIDRSYPLNDTADAVRYYAERHARGKVVIHVANAGGIGNE